MQYILVYTLVLRSQKIKKIRYSGIIIQMIIRLIKKCSLLAGMILLLSINSAPVLALTKPIQPQNPTAGGDDTKSQIKPVGPTSTINNPPTTTQPPTTVMTDTTTQPSTKVSDPMLKVCELHQRAINTIIERIITRGQNQLNLFTTITQRVETFKTSSNLTVPNYDQLVAALSADQSKAANDLSAMKANSMINCTSSDPKGVVSTFQANLKQEVSDLNTYKTDLKTLIAAVKTAAEPVANVSPTTKSTTTGGN